VSFSPDITAKDLWVGYGGAPVLKGVSFDVAKGEFVGILGPNACGKSTLVKTLTGILRPTQGKIRVGGLDPATALPRDLARAVATVPQSTEIPFPFPGREVVAMGRFSRIGRFAPLSAEDIEAVRRAMTETDTHPLADRPITEVSGGERQRLVLARALAQETPLILLDEATAAMDVHRKIDAFDCLAARNRSGITVVAVMHDLNLAALYCRRLILMREGVIHADGPTAEVFTPDILGKVYDTPLEVFTHAATGRPHVIFLPRRREVF
jgi:iron complex transport system ATP-binding protein